MVPTYFVLADMVVVLLAKAETAAKWSGVTAEDVKANQARQPKTNPSDPNGGIMDLMKQMYDEGDDKMKQVRLSACSSDVFMGQFHSPTHCHVSTQTRGGKLCGI